MYPSLHASINVHEVAHPHANTHAHGIAHALTHMRMHKHTHTRIDIRTHAPTSTIRLIHDSSINNIFIHADGLAHTPLHAHTLTRTHTHTRSCTRTVCAHACTRAYARGYFGISNLDSFVRCLSQSKELVRELCNRDVFIVWIGTFRHFSCYAIQNTRALVHHVRLRFTARHYDQTISPRPKWGGSARHNGALP